MPYLITYAQLTPLALAVSDRERRTETNSFSRLSPRDQAYTAYAKLHRSGPPARLVERSFGGRDPRPIGTLPLDVGGSCTSKVFVKRDTDKDYGYLVRCRNCPSCLRARRYQWSLRAEWEMFTHYRTWFFTGTFRNQSKDFEEVSEGVTLFLKRLRKRAYAKDVNFRYLIMPERHKSGAWHYHALFHEHGEKVTERDIRLSWQHGYCWPKLVKDRPLRAANYITKYATKDLLDDESLRRPRIRASIQPKYGGPVIMSDLEDVQKIMQAREVERLNETWEKNIKEIMREHRKDQATDPHTLVKEILANLTV